MKRTKTNKLTVTAIMSAMASVLMFLDFPIPFFPPFLKMDVSNIPAIICAFAIGPLWGVAVELIKNLVHMTASRTGFVGELSSFIVGTAFVLPSAIIYRKNHTKIGAILGLTIGTLSMTIIGVLSNYFIILPFYSKIMPFDKIIELSAMANGFITDKITLLLYGITPFNILKGTIISIITLFIYKPLSPILHRSSHNNSRAL